MAVDSEYVAYCFQLLYYRNNLSYQCLDFSSVNDYAIFTMLSRVQLSTLKFVDNGAHNMASASLDVTQLRPNALTDLLHLMLYGKLQVNTDSLPHSLTDWH